ncbi:MAG: porin [Gammaproteobacteria bacterium]|nr:porin [Gammaproteobacteria bacterium]
MNKRLLAIAIAAGLAVSSNVMAEGAEIYGIAHVSVDKMSYDDSAEADDWNVTSRNSRLGVKGSEDLGGGMKAVYKMEFSVDVSDAGTLGGRNQYVGVSAGMGTVLLGRHDSPTKMAQGKADVFNDTIADMANFGVDGDERFTNTITYFSPKMGGMQAIVQLKPGEGVACAGDVCDGIADGTSLSFTYEAGDLYVGFGMDSGDLIADQMRLAATYKIDTLQVGFLYNARSDDALAATDNAEDEVAMGLSAKFGMGDNAVKAQFFQLSDIDGTANDDATNITLGYDMNMSARTTVYALYSMYSPDVTPDDDVTAFSVGVSHSF